MTRQEAIKQIESLLRCIERTKIEICHESKELWKLSLAALLDQEERENPERLTIEELKGMDGPVWLSCKTFEGKNGYWCLCQNGMIILPSRRCYEAEEIPHWDFYRYERKGCEPCSKSLTKQRVKSSRSTA